MNQNSRLEKENWRSVADWDKKQLFERCGNGVSLIFMNNRLVCDSMRWKTLALWIYCLALLSCEERKSIPSHEESAIIFEKKGNLEARPDDFITSNSYVIIHENKEYDNLETFFKEKGKNGIRMVFLQGKYLEEDQRRVEQFLKHEFGQDIWIIPSYGNRTPPEFFEEPPMPSSHFDITIYCYDNSLYYIYKGYIFKEIDKLVKHLSQGREYSVYFRGKVSEETEKELLRPFKENNINIVVTNNPKESIPKGTRWVDGETY